MLMMLLLLISLYIYIIFTQILNFTLMICQHVYIYEQEFVSCIHISTPGQEFSNPHTLSVVSYFAAQDKLYQIEVDGTNDADRLYENLEQLFTV